eukprot:591147_1
MMVPQYHWQTDEALQTFVPFTLSTNYTQITKQEIEHHIQSHHANNAITLGHVPVHTTSINIEDTIEPSHRNQHKIIPLDIFSDLGSNVEIPPDINIFDMIMPREVTALDDPLYWIPEYREQLFPVTKHKETAITAIYNSFIAWEVRQNKLAPMAIEKNSPRNRYIAISIDGSRTLYTKAMIPLPVRKK